MALGHEKKDYVCDIISSCTFAGKEFVRKKVVLSKKEERLVMYRNKKFKEKQKGFVINFDRNFRIWMF